VTVRNSRLDEIARTLVVAAGVAPAACVAISARTSSGWHIETGAAFRGEAGPAGAETYFDLASVTKPFVAVSAARLAQRGRFSLRDSLAQLLPEARGTETGALPLELFLAHRAGLEAHRALFAPLLAERPFVPAAAIREVLLARRADCGAPGETEGYAPVYSDLGYALVGLALERIEGMPLDHVVQREVLAPLGLDIGSARQLRARTPDFTERCAPTETVIFRGGPIRGFVHDENAWALSGHALSGHAGLFGTAAAVARFGAALLDAHAGRKPEWLSAEALAPLVRIRTGGTLRAGFDGKSASGSSAGELASAHSFGHLGFTGTSLWCDPLAARAWCLLSNRVCPTRENTRIRAARPVVHDALLRAAETAA